MCADSEGQSRHLPIRSEPPPAGDRNQVSLQAISSGRRPISFAIAIIVAGLLIGSVTVLSLSLFRPAVFVVLFCGLLLVLPTFFVRNPSAYWLFLLVASIPFDIYKSLSRWIVAPEVLVERFGAPTAGNASLDFYLTDAVLSVMVAYWLVRLAMKLDRFYFPKVGYLFVLYLIWSLIGNLVDANSLFVASLEWCRQALYFLSFLFFVNNVKTRTQFRTVVFAIFVGLGLAITSVIAFSAMGIGTDVKAFDILFSKKGGTHTKGLAGSIGRAGTMYAVSGERAGDPKRSEGIFSHPAIAAAYLGLTVPLALSFLAAARRWRYRILFGGIVVSGYISSYLTFSRAGLLGLLIGSGLLWLFGRRYRVVSQKMFLLGTFTFALILAISVPILSFYLGTRPASYYGRFEYAEIALTSYLNRPFLGAGLNNGSSAIKKDSQSLPTQGPKASEPSIPCHYLVILVESGIVGFLLFFAFFWQLALIAFRTMKTADAESKTVMAGVIGGFGAIAFQNLADNPLAGHAISALIWLMAAMIIIVARRAQAEKVPAPATKAALATPQLALATGGGLALRRRSL